MKIDKIDAHATLEFGFRIQSTQASYRELEGILGADQKLVWARTAAHPNRTKFFKVDGTVDDSGRIVVPDNVKDVFTKHGGFLMVKLVTSLPPRHYANLAMYSPDGGGKLWEFDRVQAQRDNGDWVYSMPIHGLDKPGEGKRFFFIIRLDGTSESLMLTVDRVEITRGAHHFTVRRESYKALTATAANLPGVAANLEVTHGKETTKPLKGLPIGSAIAEFLEYQRNGVRG